MINITRLASLSFFRWILRLFSFGIRRDSVSPGEWVFPSLTVEAVARQDVFKYLRLPECAFLHDAVIIMQKVVVQEAQLGSMDRIHQIADAIIDTFSFKSWTIENKLSSSSFWRIVLLRLLIQLCNDLDLLCESTSRPGVLRAFADAVNVKFIVLILSKVDDAATFCLTFRLFGIFLEFYPSMVRDFAALDPFRLLSPKLSDSFAVVIVSFGVFFRAPHNDVPYLDDVSDFDGLIASLLEDKWDKGGPAYDDITQTSDLLLPSTITQDFILPLLLFILDGVHSGYEGLEDNEASRSIFILNVLRKGLIKFSALKKSLVSKVTVEKLATILASYEDLDEPLDDAIIPLRNAVYEETKRLVKLIAIESIRLKEPAVISYVTQRSPETSIECINIIVKKALESNDLFVSVQAVGAMLVTLIPSIRCRMYDEDSCLLILEHVIVLMRALMSITSGDESKVETLIVDFVYLARYLCIVCLYHGTRNSFTASSENMPMRKAVHICYTSIDLLLIQPMQEDASSLVIESTEAEVPSMGNKVIDLLSKSLNQKSSVESAYKSPVFAEVKALTRIFPALIFRICFSLVHSADTIVRRDISRVVAYLAIKKFNQMNSLLSFVAVGEEHLTPNRINIFQDIIAPLLPQKEVLPLFLKSYREYDSHLEGETERLDVFFTSLADFLTSKHPVSDALENIFSRYFPDDVPRVSKRSSLLQRGDMRVWTVNGKNASEFFVEFIDRRMQFENLCNKWLCSGYMSLSAGALEWKKIWSGVMCGVVWGDIAHCVFDDCETENDVSGDFPDFLNWRLDVLEGPERARFRLEQNVSQTKVPKTLLKSREEDLSERHYSVEDLYNKLLRDGVIRRDSSVNDEEESYGVDDYPEKVSATDENRLGTPSRILKRIESKEVLYIDFSSPTWVAANEVNIKDAVATRSQMLVDIVKGIIGPSEWYDGKTANVERLCGLETLPALLVITARNIHILRYHLWILFKRF